MRSTSRLLPLVLLAGFAFSQSNNPVAIPPSQLPLVSATAPPAAPSGGRAQTPEQQAQAAATAADHQNMMEQLHIAALRRGRDGTNNSIVEPPDTALCLIQTPVEQLLVASVAAGRALF